MEEDSERTLFLEVTEFQKEDGIVLYVPIGSKLSSEDIIIEDNGAGGDM